MTKVLVTGGTGMLGREIVTKLVENGYTARIMSRGRASANLQSGTEWAQADIETGQGVSEAVHGIDTIVHAASSPFTHTQQVDVDGTRLLLEQARAANVSHIVYISIVGIDRIPFGYYQCKLAAEESIKNAGIPWSILRATQLHYLVDLLLQAATKLPLVSVLPTNLQFQPVAAREVAGRLCDIVMTGPGGRLPDMGGPQVYTLGEMAKTWLAIRKMHRTLIHLPLPGKVAQGFRLGYNTCPESPEQMRGKVTWAEWVQQKYQSRF
ncbi:MAG: NAD(P)H-binding protein [Chloroflexi bacterium]|nr:NAD(P)H-binding protein [Chloroflexota bacterium]